ncbi:MAG: heme exporter protein CcmB [Acidobacteriota bacterium]|jgi:heme exporter protein B
MRPLLTLIAKDLRSEWHSKEVLSATVFFAVIAMTVIHFGFEPGQFQVEQVGAGILWTSFLFAAMLGMNRLFQAEHERGGLEGLMLCPVDRTTLYLAKCASLFVLLTATVLASLFLFIVFFTVRLNGHFLALAFVCLLGTLGLSALGTTFAAMAAKTRARDVLLPLLLVPIGIPLLIASVKCTAAVLRGDELASVAGWLQLLLAFDVIFLAAGYLTFPPILEE